MAKLIINVSFAVEFEVDDSALHDDTHIDRAHREVYEALYNAFPNNSTRFTTVEPQTLVIGNDVYDL